MDSKTITYYGYAGSPPCCLVQAVFDHIGIEHEFKETVPMKDTRSEEFLKINPYGKVPVIQEGDFVLNESYAIARYLARQSTDEHFYPVNDPKKAAKIDALIDFDVQTFKKGFEPYTNEVLYAVFFQGKDAPTEERKAELQKAVDDNFKQLDDILKRNGGDYVNGEHLTLADFSIFVSTLYVVAMAGGRYDTHSRVAEWWDRIAAMPVMAKILEDQKVAFQRFKDNLGK